MSAHLTTSRHGFTLVEMVVVIGIITMLLSAGIPSLLMTARRVDQGATPNLLLMVHRTQQRLARQFPNDGNTYGFSLCFSDATSMTGFRAAPAMIPWVINASGVVLTQDNGVDLRSEIGGTDFWEGESVVFGDKLRPVGPVMINGSSNSVGAGSWLHIAYEPRTGFPHAAVRSTAALSLTASDFGMGNFGELTAPASRPSALELPVRSRDGRERKIFKLFGSGVAGIHAAP